MTQEGQIVLFPFPNTDQTRGKLRPALVLRQCPSQYDDWLICMISSQLAQYISDLDEIIAENDADFNTSGLRLFWVYGDKPTLCLDVTRLSAVPKNVNRILLYSFSHKLGRTRIKASKRCSNDSFSRG